MSDPVYECDKCGLCCSKLIVEIEGVDVIREPRLVDVAMQMRGFEPDGGKEIERSKIPMFERTYLLVCSEPCKFLGSDCGCQIYSTRPTVCVAFEAGSEQCQDIREEAGLPPLKPK